MYTKPRTPECVALIILKDEEIQERLDFCIYPRNVPDGKKSITFVNKMSFHLDLLTFPLMFPSGDLELNFEFK